MTTAVTKSASPSTEMRKMRTVTCEVCGGDGGYCQPAAYSAHSRWIPCPACDGKGEYEVETEPVECDDDLEER